jgi:hypothetical protein
LSLRHGGQQQQRTKQPKLEQKTFGFHDGFKFSVDWF